MRGQLFRRGNGFAAVHEPNGTAETVGEVLELPATGAEQILESLDRYEGIGRGLPGPPVYARQRVPVLLEDAGVLECWAWIYCGSVTELLPVRNGDAFTVLLRG